MEIRTRLLQLVLCGCLIGLVFVPLLALGLGIVCYIAFRWLRFAPPNLRAQRFANTLSAFRTRRQLKYLIYFSQPEPFDASGQSGTAAVVTSARQTATSFPRILSLPLPMPHSRAPTALNVRWWTGFSCC